MAGDKFKIGSLNDALDAYLSKMERVNLSRDVLLRNRELIESTVSQLERLDSLSREVDLSDALTDGERSIRRGVLSDVRRGMLDGVDLSSSFRSEGRQLDLARQGSGLHLLSRLSGSDRQAMQRVSDGLRGSGLRGYFDLMSPAQLHQLLQWSVRGGLPQMVGGMGVAMQHSALHLGGSLSGVVVGSGDSVLEDELEESVRDNAFELAVSSIQHTSDAILDTLGSIGSRGDSRGEVSSRGSKLKDVRSEDTKKGDSSWWDTLTSVAAIGGTAAVVLRLFGSDSVQEFMSQMSTAEGRQRWWDDVSSGLQSKWDKLSSTVSSIWDTLSDVYTTIKEFTKSPDDVVSSSLEVGSRVYGSLDSSSQGMVQSVRNEFLSQEGVRVPGVEGDANVLSSFGKETGKFVEALGLGALTYKGVRVGSKVVKSVKSLFDLIYPRAAVGAAGAGASMAGLAAVLPLLGLLDEAKRKAFNSLSAAEAFKRGHQGAFLFLDGSSSPTYVPFLLLKDSSGETMISNMSDADQLAAVTMALPGIDAARRVSNNSAILNGALRSGKLSRGDRKVVEDLLESGDGAAYQAFLDSRPDIAKMGFEESGWYVTTPADVSGHLTSNSGYSVYTSADELQAAAKEVFGDDVKAYNDFMNLRQRGLELSGDDVLDAHEVSNFAQDASFFRKKVLWPMALAIGNLTGSKFYERTVGGAYYANQNPLNSTPGFSPVVAGVLDFAMRNLAHGGAKEESRNFHNELNSIRRGEEVDLSQKSLNMIADSIIERMPKYSVGGNSVVSNASSVNISLNSNEQGSQ